MDTEHLIQVSKELEMEVENAKRQGYEFASSVLTEEVKDLIARIYRKEVGEPVNLKYKSGIQRNFLETDLCQCKQLQEKWALFVASVEGHGQNPQYQALLKRIRDIK